MLRFEVVRSTFFERVEVTLCSLWDDSWCGQSGPKLVYRNCESVSQFEDRMMLPCVYQMSENGVYPFGIHSCPFTMMKSSKQTFPDPTLGGSRWPFVALN